MIKPVNLKVSLGKNSYKIFIGKKIFQDLTNFIPNFPKYSKKIIIIDSNVYKKNVDFFNAGLIKNFNYEKIIVPDGEKTKSFFYLENLTEKIIKMGVDRDSLIICVGGGVLGDLVALTSSLILRGIDLIQIPSTLLAQVDSSVGGKTAINSKYGKNLIGTFKQPKSVIISTDLLGTLQKREIISGYAEILKYAMIKDKIFFKWLEQNGNKIISLDTKSCIYAIKKSCSIKSSIVSIDEKEKGVRELLNFGHTFGHAIESFTGYSNKIKHGEAIFIGMYLALKFSCFMKICNIDVLNMFKEHLIRMKIPFKLEDYKIEISYKALIKHLKFDKKIKKNKIKLILLKDIGKPTRIFLNDEKLLSNFLKNELK